MHKIFRDKDWGDLFAVDQRSAESALESVCPGLKEDNGSDDTGGGGGMARQRGEGGGVC